MAIKDEIIARENSTFNDKEIIYRVARSSEFPDNPYHVEMRYEGSQVWDTAMQGHYPTKQKALEKFAERYRGDVERVKAENPIVKKSIENMIKNRTDEQQRRLEIDRKRQSDYEKEKQFAERLNKGLTTIHFKTIPVGMKITDKDGSDTIKTVNSPVYRGLAITGGDEKPRRYNLTHTDSGLDIGNYDFTTLKEAKMAAYRLTEVIDFDKPADEVKAQMTKLPEAQQMLRSMRANVYTMDGSDLKRVETPKPPAPTAKEERKPNRKPLKDMTKEELKSLNVRLHVLPDGTLWIKEKGKDSLERTVASWNPPNRPDMTEKSDVGGYIMGEMVSNDAKKWLDAVAKKYDLDENEIMGESWQAGGMINKNSPYEYITNQITGKTKTSKPQGQTSLGLKMDKARTNKNIIDPNDEKAMKRWRRDPGYGDVIGVDSPTKKRKTKKRKVRKPTTKAPASLKSMR